MSRSRQTLLGRLTLGALVAGSLTFGGVQALAGAGVGASSYVCTTRPYDQGCANYCVQQYPGNGGAHVCAGAVPGGYECVCAT
jgi:hypothetical protein